MLQFLAAYLGNMNNANFGAFMERFKVLVDKQGGTALGIETGVLSALTADVQAFHDVVNRTVGSEITAQLTQADAQRDRLYKFVRNVLLNSKNAASADIASLWDLIDAKLLSVYEAGIVDDANSQESAKLTGFVTDVRRYLTAEQISALGIATELDELLTWNSKYDALFVARAEEKATTEQGLTQTLRTRLIETYRLIGNTAAYFASLAPSADEALNQRAAQCTQFIRVANALIVEFRTRIAIGQAVSETAKKKKAAAEKASSQADASTTQPQNK